MPLVESQKKCTSSNTWQFWIKNTIKYRTGMLIERCGILNMKNGNLSLLSKSFYKKMLSLIVMSWSRKVACAPWYSPFSSSSLEYIFLKDLRYSLASLMAQRSSMNLTVPRYLYVPGDITKLSFWHILIWRNKEIHLPKMEQGLFPLECQCLV